MTTRWTTFVVAAALVCLGVVPADAQKKDGPAKPLGTWTRTTDQHTLTFDIQADGLKILLKIETNSVTVHADYGVTKDGILFARMGKIERMGIDEGPMEGDLISFKFTVKGDELTVEDLQGTRVNDDAKRIVQGAYKKAKK